MRVPDVVCSIRAGFGPHWHQTWCRVFFLHCKRVVNDMFAVTIHLLYLFLGERWTQSVV